MDYQNISKISIPDDYNESPDNADDGEEPKRNELIYVVARVFREEADAWTNKPLKASRWVYERYNQVFTSEQYPNISETLSKL